jgi:hypothetical protein
MTDPHDLDELASAQLDGTTSPEEAALLADDPALRTQVEARVEELRAVRQALAEPPAVDPARRDAAIAAALVAFDDEGSQATVGATVTPLAPRRGLSPRAVRALSAAAVVLLLALLVPLLANIERDDDTASFDSTGAAIESEGGSTGGDNAAEDQGASPEAEEAAPGASPTSAGAVAIRDIGSYDDLDALAAAVASDEDRSGDTAFNTDGDEARCEPPTSSRSAMFLATVGGVPVEVFVRTAPDGTRTMIVLNRGTCERLEEREL